MKGRNLSPGNSQQHKIPDLDIIDLEKENRSASQASDSPSDPQSADSPPCINGSFLRGDAKLK